MRRVMRMGLIASVMLVATSRQARADPYVNPWAGVIFGNDQANTGFRSFGASFGEAGGSVWGTETNIGFSPGFFGNAIENYVLDFMAGITLGPTYASKTGRRVHPYGVGEFGVIRTNIEADPTVGSFARNNLGLAVGAGVTIDLNDRFGFRGDGRYFRTFKSEDAINSLGVHLADFEYWRAAVGLTLH